MPQLVDIDGRLTIGAYTDGECSAPVVSETRTSAQLGVYIDDETPNIQHWIDIAVAKYGAYDPTKPLGDSGLVIVGISMSTPRLRFPNVLNAQEWYPYHSGFPLWEWGTMPRSKAYILQHDFVGFRGTKPPTNLQRRLLVAAARLRRPKLILRY